MKTLFLVLLIAFLLAGCKIDKDGTIEFATVDIPESLLECLPVPMRDKPFVKINERQAAILLARYKTAHSDCYDKLSRVRTLYLQYKQTYPKVDNTGVIEGLNKWLP